MSQIGRLCGIQKKREQENGDERCGGRGGEGRGEVEEVFVAGRGSW